MAALYIHVGLPKTGTTSAQEFFTKKSLRLEEAGIRYPRAGRATAAHHNLAYQFLRKPKFKKELGSWSDLRLEMSLNPKFDYIVSSELLHALSDSAVKAVSKILEGVDVKIVVYLREQAAHIESMFLQTQKVGKPTGTFDEYFEAQINKEIYQHYDYLQKWQLFGPASLIVRVFERERLVNGNVVDDILDVIKSTAHFEDDESELLVSKNTTLGSRTVLLNQRLSEEFDRINFKDKATRIKTLRAIKHVSEHLGWNQERPAVLEQKHVDKCRELFEKQNHMVAQSYLSGQHRSLFADTQVRATSGFGGALDRTSANEWVSVVARLVARLARSDSPARLQDS